MTWRPPGAERLSPRWPEWTLTYDFAADDNAKKYRPGVIWYCYCYYYCQSPLTIQAINVGPCCVRPSISHTMSSVVRRAVHIAADRFAC